MPEPKQQVESAKLLVTKLEAMLTHQIRTLPRGPRMRDRIRILETAYRQACNVNELITLATEIGIDAGPVPDVG